ncbi:polysaccharide pyruvyl transferase family protein [Methylobacterium sp. J-026]|uniref:polysaccharide pyruvyl transferase family protein n=1 Tax=Methylobacterium sp. J-026 TaxID=2836624 RepID=UPI001FBB51C6|nr:polysaccharide pyruvyl transferase family protein [Methylobacterium sp. J-026]MCJ2133983.1 polysaccharide pyruvyl transferase family protein [Methylobacterium sp. J-026]
MALPVISNKNVMILIRTHFFDEKVLSLAQNLSGGGKYEVAILADHRSWEFPTGDWPVISVTWDNVNALGLKTDGMSDVLWQCGDYGLYIAREKFPQVKYFWLFEYDVVVHAPNIAEILEKFDQVSMADLLAPEIRRVDENYVWSRCVSRTFPILLRCAFSLVRVSAPALDAMRRCRHQLTERYSLGDFKWCEEEGIPSWPNDEVLTTTATYLAGLTISDFNDVVSDSYDEYSFSTNDLLHHPSDLINQACDGKIYHPVRWGRHYLNGALARSQLLKPELLPATINTIVKNIGSDWEADETVQCLRVLSNAAVKISRIQPKRLESSRFRTRGAAPPLEADRIAYWSWDRIRNFGDEIFPVLLRYLANRDGVRVTRDRPHILGPGSIFSYATTESLIWGSGILNPATRIPDVNRVQIRAVRGKLTADLLTRRGISLNDVALGDPGVLVDEALRAFGVNKSSQNCRVAIVPHHSYRHAKIFTTERPDGETCVADPSENMRSFIQKIVDSEVIVSQSLHGLILGEALNKPTLWIADTEQAADENWTFKFHDWYTNSLNPQTKPLLINPDLSRREALRWSIAAELRPVGVDRAHLLAQLPNEPPLLSTGRFIDFEVCRNLPPAVVFIDDLGATGRPYEEINPYVLASLSRAAKDAVDNHFKMCPERRYCFLISTSFRDHISYDQMEIIEMIMDNISHTDYLCLRSRVDEQYDGVPEDFGWGISVLRESGLFGHAFCVRGDFSGFSSNFLTALI